MTTKTRYFVIISLLVLTVGLGTGLLAYYVGFPTSALQRVRTSDISCGKVVSPRRSMIRGPLNACSELRPKSTQCTSGRAA